MISEKLKPFGTTIFSEMTRLALEHDAINLSQGFPDFEGPAEIRDAAIEALRAGHNQYARSMGARPLVEAVARARERDQGLRYDPLSEVVVFSGATEGLSSSMLGLLNPGDEVVLFEPVYDSYPACVAMAGAVPRYVTLRFPDFRIDPAELSAAFSARTRLIVVNSPHNPTGKVFSMDELELIAELCKKHDAIALTDEVYEHLVYDDARHVALATLPGMRERTLSVSSSGKTYSFTGWKVGWATGPRPLAAAAQAAHQFVTFATATPLQLAAAHALDHHAEAFYAQLRTEYQARRDLLVGVLDEVGLRPTTPDGAYFVLADFTSMGDADDVAFVRRLMTEVGVAAIPPSFFYPERPEAGRHLARFAFCKRTETLEAARERLRTLRPLAG